jgi:hypothetical protein
VLHTSKRLRQEDLQFGASLGYIKRPGKEGSKKGGRKAGRLEGRKEQDYTSIYQHIDKSLPKDSMA